MDEILPEMWREKSANMKFSQHVRMPKKRSTATSPHMDFRIKHRKMTLGGKNDEILFPPEESCSWALSIFREEKCWYIVYVRMILLVNLVYKLSHSEFWKVLTATVLKVMDLNVPFGKKKWRLSTYSMILCGILRSHHEGCAQELVFSRPFYPSCRGQH